MTSKTSPELVGKRLEQARLWLGAKRGREVEPRELAAAVDVSESAVSQWLAGLKRPSPDNLVGLAGYLETTPEWLLWGRGNAPQSRQDAPGTTQGRGPGDLPSVKHQKPQTGKGRQRKSG